MTTSFLMFTVSQSWDWSKLSKISNCCETEFPANSVLRGRLQATFPSSF